MVIASLAKRVNLIGKHRFKRNHILPQF